MKFSYDILPARRLNILRFSGSITLQDVLAGMRTLWADPRYDKAYNGIVDLQGVTTRATVSDVRALIAFLQEDNLSRGRWAAIFTEPKTTALGMLFKVACPSLLTLEIVSTWEAACRYLWVDLPPLPLASPPSP